jgi:hypothetical protein
MSKAKSAKAKAPKPAKVTAAPIKSEPEESCGTCHCWREGRCRRYPPSKVPGEQVSQHRVVTAAADWCGEWRHV